MKIALIQTALVWENALQNRINFEKIISTISQEIDIIVLPEMFTSGFTMQPQNVAETMAGETILWLQDLAKLKNCAITGSLVITENNNYYNRMVFVFPDGTINFYDKKHLFTLAGEHIIYKSGDKKVVIEFRGFKICTLICYDLRFPVFARNIENYDLLLYVANWPSVRIAAWDALLIARAIENMSYTIGVNRIGTDNNNHVYTGHSQVVDYMGNYVLEPQLNNGVYIVDINNKEQIAARQKFGFLNDKDNFKLE